MELTVIELDTAEIVFFSQFDESAFFEWLNKISCVEKFEGQGTSLYVSVNPDALDGDALRELIALFHRYRLNMSVLLAFDREEFSEWLHNKDAYWHENLFERNFPA